MRNVFEGGQRSALVDDSRKPGSGGEKRLHVKRKREGFLPTPSGVSALTTQGQRNRNRCPGEGGRSEPRTVSTCYSNASGMSSADETNLPTSTASGARRRRWRRSWRCRQVARRRRAAAASFLFLDRDVSINPVSIIFLRNLGERERAHTSSLLKSQEVLAKPPARASGEMGDFPPSGVALRLSAKLPSEAQFMRPPRAPERLLDPCQPAA
ncbi:hypothetical protein ABIC32_000796 [Brevundimonas sp. 1080]